MDGLGDRAAEDPGTTLTRAAALALLDQGADALDGGDPEAALTHLERVARLAPAELAGRGALGAAESCARLGRDTEAEAWLASAIDSGDREIGRAHV